MAGLQALPTPAVADADEVFRMTGFEYFQEEPVERFRVPDQSNPLTAGALLLAFAAYPTVAQLRSRQRASDALQAWFLRAALEHGIKIKPPSHLSRKNLDPRLMRRRVYDASKRIEHQALDLVGLAMDMTFFRSEGPEGLARLLGAWCRAKQVSVHVPRGIDTDVVLLKDHLSRRKSSKALDHFRAEDTLRDFRRRVWKVYLPALPLLTAIHVDCLSYNFHKRAYDVAIPGFPRRHLAISLLLNPELWVHSVILKARVRRAMMVTCFPPHTFPEILGEQETPSWLSLV